MKKINRSQKIFEIYTNLTGLFRNLAIDSECIAKFLETDVNKLQLYIYILFFLDFDENLQINRIISESL